jgi:predicted nucleic acid-binding protein
VARGYLLDTNVLSELMRPQPAPEVMAWFEHNHGAAFHTSAITQAEILLGIALLPDGKRRNALAEAAERMFREDFAGRCLPFGESAANEYALLVAARTRAGQPISTEDAQIAAIALTHRLPLVTRNQKDFTRIDGLETVNPWNTGNA